MGSEMCIRDRPGGKARSLSREQKDDNIIKLSFERDEKEEKRLVKAQET